MKEYWIVEGVMPERALERLQKAGICIEKAKKIQKNGIVFCINKKDCEKAFAIYPNMCYNSKCESIRSSVYAFTKVGEKSVRAKSILKARLIGAMLGCVLFAWIVAACSPIVLRMEFVGANVYKREVVAILKEEGIALFAPYQTGKEELLESRILTLDGVEFCSVQKYGNAVRIELRTNAFATAKRETGSLVAPKSGIVVQAVVLGGTILKQSGEEVQEGETLLADYFLTAEGERVSTTAIGKVKLLCEACFDGSDETAFKREARLLIETLGGELVEYVTNEGGFTVRYTITLKKNM